MYDIFSILFYCIKKKSFEITKQLFFFWQVCTTKRSLARTSAVPVGKVICSAFVEISKTSLR